jgi:hypothetical protein
VTLNHGQFLGHVDGQVVVDDTLWARFCARRIWRAQTLSSHVVPPINEPILLDAVLDPRREFRAELGNHDQAVALSEVVDADGLRAGAVVFDFLNLRECHNPFATQGFNGALHVVVAELPHFKCERAKFLNLPWRGEFREQTRRVVANRYH